jgi:predicted nucleic acid-binding protein
MAVIVDTSCLIILSKIGKIDYLKRLFREILIPQSVLNEFGETIPDFIEVYQEPIDINILQRSQVSLDEGETEVIALAIEKNAEGVVIDEKKGRKVAKRMGLKVIGTLGLLALANTKGIVEDIEQVIKEVKDQGFFISDKHLADIRQKCKLEKK